MKNSSSTRARITRRLVLPAAAAAVVGAASLTGAGAASAHVSAFAPTVTQGGYGVVTLAVPNESDAAATTQLRVTMPGDGLASARPETTPGWKAVVTKKDDRVTEITWTADPGSAGIPIGQFAQFSFSGGPFPEQETVTLPTLQVFADGEKVDWNEPTPANGTEPDRPAPVLTLATGSGARGDAHQAATTATPQAAPSSSNDSSSTADSAARWLGGIGLLVGVLGVVFSVAALRVVRKNGRFDA